jgi:hypothetical protein
MARGTVCRRTTVHRRRISLNEHRWPVLVAALVLAFIVVSAAVVAAVVVSIRSDTRTATLQPTRPRATTTQPTTPGSTATPEPTTTLPGATVPAAIALRAGAEANMDRLPIVSPTSPSGIGRLITVGSVGDLQRAVDDAIGGDVIVLTDGTYQGRIRVPSTAVGTATEPIVVRSETRRGAVFTDCGAGPCFEVQGEHIHLSQLAFRGVDTSAVNLDGRSNVVYDSVFDSVGGWCRGDLGGPCQAGNVYTFGDRNHDYGSTGQWIAALDPPMVDRNHTIVANEFLRPRATPLFQGHGSVGNTFSHNIIRGPRDYDSQDGMAIKVGWGFAHEDVRMRIAYNSIYDWDGNGYYYTIGIKASGVEIVGNYLNDGTISIRSGNDSVVRGNMIERNGGIVLEGVGHLVEDNYVRNATSMDGDGFQKPALGLFVRILHEESGAPFDGIGGPYYYEEVRDSVVRNNTFVSTVARDGTVSFIAQSFTPEVRTETLPRNNQFSGNWFVTETSPAGIVGGNGPAADWVGQIVDANTWLDNRFVHTGGPASAVQVPGGLLGTNGNVALGRGTVVPSPVTR